MARIFLCHASEDKAQVREVYQRLRVIDGFEPWLDEEDLLPGQNWALEIQRVLQTSDFILIFLSRISVAKRGYVQREMKMALDALQEIPEGVIHTIPVRIDDCNVPEFFRSYQWVNLFDSNGFDRIVRAIRAEIAKWPGPTPQPSLQPSPRPNLPEAPATLDTAVEPLMTTTDAHRPSALTSTLRRRLIEALLWIPAYQTFNGRTSLLDGLPSTQALSRDENAQRDLEGIINQLDRLGRCATGLGR